MDRKRFLLIVCTLVTFGAQAQFTGPGVAAPTSTVAQVQKARLGTYVTLSGLIVGQQRQNYYTFRDASGEIRVEIDPSVWQNRKVGPDTKVRLVGEVDQGTVGRYVWVKSLELVS